MNQFSNNASSNSTQPSAAVGGIPSVRNTALRATQTQTPQGLRRIEPGAAPQQVARRQPESQRGLATSEGRKMVIAAEITLSGQISKCDYLVVEGGVEGMRYDGRSLEVTESGFFNGSIEVDSADIAGVFEGIMHVRGRLSIQPTGRITGTVRYGELEINAGGQVNGELQSIQNATADVVSTSRQRSNPSQGDAEKAESSPRETAAAS